MPSTEHPMRRVLYITLAHTTVDFYMTLFPPLLATFKTHFGLSLVQASLLPTVATVFGSFPQPFMGYAGDRSNRMALAGLGVLICGLLVSIIGFAPSAPILALFLIGSALGSSLFHPTGGGMVTASQHGRTNLAMAVFLTGGTLGMAIAPITGTQVVSRYGLENLWIIGFPCLFAAALLFRLSRTADPAAPTTPAGRIDFNLLKTAAVRPLWTLYSISVLRSIVHSSYVSFTAILGESRGWSIGKIGWVVSAYFIATTLGRIVGGYFGDRIAPRKLLAFSNILSAFFFIGFCFTPGWTGIALFLTAGFIFDLGISTNIVLAQRILPQNTSTATGMVMGFAWGAAGLMIPLVGSLAETFSLPIALAVISAALFPAAALVAALPAPKRPARASVSAAGTD